MGSTMLLRQSLRGPRGAVNDCDVCTPSAPPAPAPGPLAILPGRDECGGSDWLRDHISRPPSAAKLGDPGPNRCPLSLCPHRAEDQQI